MTTAPTYEGYLTKIITVTHTGTPVNYDLVTGNINRTKDNLAYLETQLQETLARLREQVELFKRNLVDGHVFALVAVQLTPILYPDICRQVIIGTGTILYGDAPAIPFVGASQLVADFSDNPYILSLLETFRGRYPLEEAV